MRKSFLTFSMLCLLSLGFVSQVNARMAADCNAAHLAAYDSSRSAGLSHDQAADVADRVYRACAGIQ